ncbi:hypothetical protein D1007_02080 [Hordeum vulgare]|nr:hypothetical protein D1007_02080 [Hordeum vulgare]
MGPPRNHQTTSIGAIPCPQDGTLHAGLGSPLNFSDWNPSRFVETQEIADMASSVDASAGRGKDLAHLSVLMYRFHVEDDELDNLVHEDEANEPKEKPKWLALSRVLTGGQGVVIAHMKVAWNQSREVIWHIINPNLFSVQFQCVADWNKAMHQGPWDFKGMVLVIVEYDGFKTQKE